MKPFPDTVAQGCLAGILSLLGGLLLFLAAGAALPGVGILALFNLPLVALLWALPLWFFQRRRRPRFAAGWILIHAVAALINGACLGALLSGKIPIGG